MAELALDFTYVALFSVLALSLTCWLFSSTCRRGQAKEKVLPSQEHSEPQDARLEDSSQALNGTFIPSTGLIKSNQRPCPFENSHCSGHFLALHRPTHDKALNDSGDYAYSHHFHGRKRLWEMRWSIKFKKDVPDAMRFGIELSSYVPTSAGTKRIMELIVKLLRQYVGNELYHSPGDNPSVAGEQEKPTFTMPMIAFDQIIITPEGEQPPDLSDHGFADLGMKRTDSPATFIKEVSKLKLKAGPTYTLAFWGISQFLDVIRWQLQKVIPFKPIDFNSLCGSPPVSLVLYTLDENGFTDKRHLQSRKRYYFRLAFWSSMKPPEESQLENLLPASASLAGRADRHPPKSRKGWEQSLFACCR